MKLQRNRFEMSAHNAQFKAQNKMRWEDNQVEYKAPDTSWHAVLVGVSVMVAVCSFIYTVMSIIETI